jgi:hypothetical protein
MDDGWWIVDDGWWRWNEWNPTTPHPAGSLSTPNQPPTPLSHGETSGVTSGVTNDSTKYDCTTVRRSKFGDGKVSRIEWHEFTTDVKYRIGAWSSGSPKAEVRREYAASTSCRPSTRVVNRCPSRYRQCMSRVFCLSAVTVLARLDVVGQIPLPTRYALDRYSAPYHTDGHPPGCHSKLFQAHPSWLSLLAAYRGWWNHRWK